MAHFTDEAEDWFEDFLDDNENPTWRMFEQAFRNKYENRRWLLKWRKDLKDLKQRPGESIETYAYEFKKLAKKIPGLRPADKFELFVDGLQPEVIKEVKLRNKNTIEEIIKLISRYEEILERIDDRKNKRPR